MIKCLAVEEAVGEFEEVVDGHDDEAEENGGADVVDMEAGDQLGGQEDNECVDDEEQQSEGDGVGGEGDDDEDGAEGVVEDGDDEGGEDDGAGSLNGDAGQEPGSHHDGDGEHHEAHQAASLASVEVTSVPHVI